MAGGRLSRMVLFSFSIETVIPSDLGIRIIDGKTPENTTRKKLFIKIGITIVAVRDARDLILDKCIQHEQKIDLEPFGETSSLKISQSESYENESFTAASRLPLKCLSIHRARNIRIPNKEPFLPTASYRPYNEGCKAIIKDTNLIARPQSLRANPDSSILCREKPPHRRRLEKATNLGGEVLAALFHFWR
jgi:hypothetical protein